MSPARSKVTLLLCFAVFHAVSANVYQDYLRGMYDGQQQSDYFRGMYDQQQQQSDYFRGMYDDQQQSDYFRGMYDEQQDMYDDMQQDEEPMLGRRGRFDRFGFGSDIDIYDWDRNGK